MIAELVKLADVATISKSTKQGNTNNNSTANMEMVL